MRVGDYRLVYVINDEQPFVLVIRVGHRKDVYRRRRWVSPGARAALLLSEQPGRFLSTVQIGITLVVGEFAPKQGAESGQEAFSVCETKIDYVRGVVHLSELTPESANAADLLDRVTETGLTFLVVVGGPRDTELVRWKDAGCPALLHGRYRRRSPATRRTETQCINFYRPDCGFRANTCVQ